MLTGLATEHNKKIGQLSKGYRQRVGLAAALIHDPEVLILDEPTSGLDPNQIIEIRELIKKLGKDKTVLFSSHILQEVEAICDRVIIINKGSIVADDELSNLQRTDKKTNIVSVEFKEDVDVAQLQKINNVDTIENMSLNEKPELKHFKLHTSNPETVRRQLMEFSLQNNYNIISLKSETLSLENIFRSLTTEH
jgi:ABC-2 type transport system ATP-binding protein